MKKISEEELHEIVRLAESVPDRFQEKCFEIILSRSLETRLPSKTTGNTDASLGIEEQVASPKADEFILPIDVKAFLTQYGLSESTIWNYFLAVATDIRPTYKLTSTTKVEVQTQHGLMMSLESAIKTGEFNVDIEQWRSRCQDEKVYDKINFSTNIKSRARLFKEIGEVEILTLSPDGKSELADLLEALAPDGE